MTSTLIAPVIVSAWPWQLGTTIYDPLLGLEVAGWELDELREMPDWVDIPFALLDPRRPLKERADELLAVLNGDQHMLLSLYEIGSPGSKKVTLQFSEMPLEELTIWLEKRELNLEEIQLDSLESFLSKLAAMPIEQHHGFCADWWERWELPIRDQPSRFRSEAGPAGSLYKAAYGDAAQGCWEREIDNLDLDDFCLWSALRLHWAWRLEFSEQAWPGLKPLDELRSLLG